MTLRELERELTGAVGRLRVSVVRIRRTAAVRAGGRRVDVEGAGSGVIVDPRGYLVTNDHVVRNAKEISATLDDGREYFGEVVGEDRATDLAVVRLDARELPAAPLADSGRLRVGQFVLAIGNSLGMPGGPSVSFGVISALGRPLPGADYVIEGLIQTDAAINPGNSGGPLADLDGSVVGVNTAMIPYAQGVGFAIPSNSIRSVVDQILRTGRVTRPWLGVSGVTVDAAAARQFGLGAGRGVLLAGIVRDGPAASAGLRPGDLLYRLGPFQLTGLHDLLSALSKLPIGGAVDYELIREGRMVRGVLRVSEPPPSITAG